jgi:hypothetical protein
MTKLSAYLTGGTVAVLVAVLLMDGALVFSSTRSAQASPKFTQETGKACNFCHTKPPALNDQGLKFKANGNRL